MKTIYLTEATRLPERSVATIGFFDGVHRGHQYLISQVVSEARRTGRLAMAVTFDRHPREVLRPDEHPELLSTLSTKLLLLSKTGIDVTVVLPFSREMAALSAQTFMHDVLLGQLGVDKLIIGYDHRFGHNRSEGFDEYVLFGRSMGMEVVQSLVFDVDGSHVSSSAIRSLVRDGEVEEARRWLGHPYTVEGVVEHGQAEGRRMGFPTANLSVEGSGQLIPRSGVYAVWARQEGQVHTRQAMMNIGTRPTFDGHRQTLEVNIFQFKGDLYGTRLSVAFVARVRDERRFGSPDDLARQLLEDRHNIEEILSDNEE